MKKHIAIILTIFTLAVTVPATAQEKFTDGIKTHRFERLMHRKNTVILDVRTVEEYQAGHIPGAVLVDATKPDFSEQVAALDRSKRYLVYCKSGRRSERAVQVMHSLGFRKTFQLIGGFDGWKGSRE